jgi:hypothetical protein
MSGTRKDWFPTPIWHFSIEDHQRLNSVLLAEIEQEQQRDRSGEVLSNVLGWNSVSNLHKLDSFIKLTQIINQNVLEIATFLRHIKPVKILIKNPIF